MESRALGQSGVTVPTVGMGTWATFDVRGAEAGRERRAVVDAALAAGTTLFDTSPMYGESERVLAESLGVRRHEALVADKVWASSGEEGRAQMDRAVAWYGGVIDIYQIHNLVSWRIHLPVLEALRERGAVRVVGATTGRASAHAELMDVMRGGRIQMVQILYNAGNRVVERDVLPLADELGLGVLVMEPLGAGRLVRRSPTARELEPLGPFGVVTWAQALLKWILSDRRVHCALPATRRVARAVENAAAGSPPWFDVETRDYVARLAAEL